MCNHTTYGPRHVVAIRWEHAGSMLGTRNRIPFTEHDYYHGIQFPDVYYISIVAIELSNIQYDRAP